MFVQLVLLGLLFKLIWRDKSRSVSGAALDQLKDLLERSSRLSAEFTAQVERSVGLMQQAAGELEARIASAGVLKTELEALALKSQQTRLYTSEDVVKLARAGYDARAIAGITLLPVGEIELMLNLDQAS